MGLPAQVTEHALHRAPAHRISLGGLQFRAHDISIAAPKKPLCQQSSSLFSAGVSSAAGTHATTLCACTGAACCGINLRVTIARVPAGNRGGESSPGRKRLLAQDLQRSQRSGAISQPARNAADNAELYNSQPSLESPPDRESRRMRGNFLKEQANRLQLANRTCHRADAGDADCRAADRKLFVGAYRRSSRRRWGSNG